MTVAVQTTLATPVPRPVVRSVTAVRHLARGGLLTLAALLLGLTAQLLFVSGLQERAAQHTAYDSLRAQLALGTAPVAQTDQQGDLLAPAPRSRSSTSPPCTCIRWSWRAPTPAS